jgi:glycerophosphoryl diester phosphodiesterase
MVTFNINPFRSTTRPLVMAHRGDQTVSPENSLLALKNASLLEIDYIETDIRMTKDNELILFHDSTLDRTTNISGRIIDYTLDQLLEKVDLGYSFTLDHGKTYPARGKDWRVVTLRQAFQLFPDMRFNLDIKNEEPEAPQLLVKLIKEFNRENNVLVASFHHKQITTFRKLLPHVPTAASLREVKNFLIRHKIRINKLFSPKYYALQVPIYYNGTRVVTRGFVKDAHDRNIAVHVWTINDRPSMEWLISQEVDGIFTDDPWLLLETLQEKELI